MLKSFDWQIVNGGVTIAEYVTIKDLPVYTGVFDKTDTVLNNLKNGNFYSEGKSYKMG